MFLHPYETLSARANMACDSLLFAESCARRACSLRFYGWERECHTCGLFQRAEDFAGILPPGTPLVKRPTGGGLVFHEFKDITYALVVPSGHVFFSVRPRESYEELHRRIAECMSEAGIAAEIFQNTEDGNSGPAQCFVSPSLGDIVSPLYGKFAGAAQRRTKAGFLLQGSIKIPSLPCGSDFREALSDAIASMLGEPIEAAAAFSGVKLPLEKISEEAV